MIKFDFNTYMDKNIIIDDSKKEDIINKLKNNNMSGFLNACDNLDLEDIKKTALNIRKNSDILLVIAIGGSYMGSYSINKIFNNSFNKKDTEVVYIGHDLSSKYLNEVIGYISDKDVTLNVISKSGETLEINLVYRLIKNELEKKYNQEELKSRIIITTSSNKGKLKNEVSIYGYKSFIINDNLGGRYSLISPAHLLPLSVSLVDIDSLVEGYRKGLNLIDDAYSYAYIRNSLFKNNKYIENFSVYNSNLYYYTEWLKQLFGESEGKNNKGILPISTVNTRDLHSLGQFIQEGNNIIFETVIKVLESTDLCIDNLKLDEINNIVTDSVLVAHYKDNIYSNLIILSKLTEENIGMLSSFFMLSAVFSAYLFDVNPFDQPGVEKYKNEVKNRIEIN